IASVVIITVGVTAALFSIGEDKDNVNIAMQTITVPAGQRVNLDLPDGSNVWLNAGTRMQYPVSFMKDKREVILDGEAYFEVAHNEKCPFVVHTSTLDVEVLGTKFNVEAYSKRKVFETSLMQGKVRVKSPENKNISVTLLPNQKTTLKSGKLVVSKIDDYNVYRWKEGLYCFKSKPFAEIMQDLERYYDLKIQLDKQSIAKVALTGKFRISDGLDYALRVLQNDVAFTYRRDKENDVIYIK
uniref:FecR family protein n=1 Tax=Bacteroides sp. TaxID=29523 RepID=UPI0026277B48